MIPEVASVWDEIARVVDQGVVDGNDALSGIAGRGFGLQKVEATIIDFFALPAKGHIQALA